MSSQKVRPLPVPASLLPLRGHYPPPESLRTAASAGTLRDREHLVRLWLSEGIPHAFGECPALYAELRGWIADALELDAKDITLIGSARLGYSLKPGDLWGRPFGPQSDIDLSLVSPQLFAQLAEEFQRFVADYGANAIHPRNDTEEMLWKENLTRVPRGLKRGAIDPKKIPTWHRFPKAQQIGTLVWNLKRRLPASTGAPKARTLSIRVYQNWGTLATIVAENLGSAAAA